MAAFSTKGVEESEFDTEHLLLTMTYEMQKLGWACRAGSCNVSLPFLSCLTGFRDDGKS